MIHGLLIAMIIVTLAHDGLRRSPLFPDLSGWAVLVCALAPPVLLALFAQLVCMLAGKSLDHRGHWRSVGIADWAVAWARGLAVLAYAVALLAFGWLDLVRAWLGGNWALVDEAIAIAPPIMVFLAGWWSYYPIERRLREAMLLRGLDEHGPGVDSLPTRWEYVSEQARHQVLFILVPVALIALWTEGLDMLRAGPGASWSWLHESGGGALMVGLHFAGIIGVLMLMPLVLRLLWNTVPLGPGEIRDRLLALCRAESVRCRDLLVWRTRSGMLNGAVVGLIPALRYILLTDALLERLPEREVEAVMAHEVGHARRHHLPWLMMAMLGGVGAGWTISWKGFGLWLGADRVNVDGPIGALVAIVSLVIAAVIGFFVFGYVSRRFEQQADAFAAQHISGWTHQNRRRRDIRISAEAVAAMAGALGRVALFNHIPAGRFSWRHGSIRSRQVRLQKLVGAPAHALPIDRLVGRLKIVSLVALGVLIAAALLDPSMASI